MTADDIDRYVGQIRSMLEQQRDRFADLPPMKLATEASEAMAICYTAPDTIVLMFKAQPINTDQPPRSWTPQAEIDAVNFERYRNERRNRKTAENRKRRAALPKAATALGMDNQ